MAKTPEEILAEERGTDPDAVEPIELDDLSTEDLAAAEDEESASDAFTDADRREEQIELDNDFVDTLVAESQEVSDETVDSDDHDRG